MKCTFLKAILAYTVFERASTHYVLGYGLITFHRKENRLFFSLSLSFTHFLQAHTDTICMYSTYNYQLYIYISLYTHVYTCVYNDI